MILDQAINDICCLLQNKIKQEDIKIIENAMYLILGQYKIEKNQYELSTNVTDSTESYIKMFMVAKKVEGCTDRTIGNYAAVLKMFFKTITKPAVQIEPNDIRMYLAKMELERGCSKVTQDNELRVLRSFYSWMQGEEYVLKNPTKKIKAVKKQKIIKQPFTELDIELLRKVCTNLRDRAMIDFLISTGVRVSEVARLNRSDIDGDQCIVFGKGQKERYVYLNAKAQLSLKEYLESREDDNEALFVSLFKPHERWAISGIESRIRELGKEAGISGKVHPHRFRRTAATFALNRGMPIEQVQQMLGHSEINTTMIYVSTSQETVKASHKKYVV